MCVLSRWQRQGIFWQFLWNTTFPVITGKAEGCCENCMEIATWYLPGHEDTLPLHWKSSFTPSRFARNPIRRHWRTETGSLKRLILRSYSLSLKCHNVPWSISRNNLPHWFDAQITIFCIKRRTRTPQNGIRVLCYQDNKRKYLVLFIIPVVRDSFEAVFPSED